MAFDEDTNLTRKLRVLRWITDCLLRVEALIALLFPLFLAFLVIAAFALLGVFNILSPWLHILLLLALGGGAIFWVFRIFFQWHWPEKDEAWRRLEKASDFSHRPLHQLADKQVTNLIDPLARTFWLAHQRMLQERIKNIRIGWPDFGIAKRDPLALRTIAVMILVIGISTADNKWAKRIGQGFVPNFAGDVSKISADVWISPPAYTNVAPIHLKAPPGLNGTTPLSIPEKSKILAQVTGTEKTVKLWANNSSVELRDLDTASQQIEGELITGNEIGIMVGNKRIADWPIDLIKDLPPHIDFAGKPAATEKGVLRLPYAARDDYGVQEAQLRVKLNDKNLDIPLTIPPRENKNVKGVLYEDLTSHPWAGLEIEARLIAKDKAHQKGESGSIRITLPERKFFNPIAKAIVAARKALVKEPGKNKEVAEALRGLNKRPDLFDHDKTIFLGLNIAWRRLISRDYGEAALPDIVQLMWEMALSLEDGRTNDALADLRKLQRQLQDALARNAPQEEIDRLLNQIQEAMNEYMRQMQQQLEQALRQGKTPRLTKPGLSVTQQDLNKMLEEARRMAQSGSKESAQKMLDQLQQMLENLQAGIPAPSQEGSGEGQQLMNDLAQTMRKQQKLLNQTFQEQQKQQDGLEQDEDGEGNSPSGNANEQDELRQTLGGLMRRMAEATGDLPAGMGQAEQQMRDAVQSLREGDMSRAAEAQNKALNHLQQSLESLGKLQRQTLGTRREKMDPLGRMLPDQDGSDGQNLDTSTTDVLDESPFEQARRIFKELLERRDDLSRSKSERDYLDRLLKQF